MEILLLIAIVLVAAAGLFVAATFNRRTRENFAPLMNDTGQIIVTELEQTGNKVMAELRTVTEELRQSKQAVRHLQEDSAELKRQMRTVTAELGSSREAVRQLQEGNGELAQRLGSVASELRRGSDLIGQAQAASAQLGEQLRGTAEEQRQDRQAARGAADEAARRLEAAREELGRQLRAVEEELQRSKTGLGRLDERVASFGKSLAAHNARVSGIYRYVARRETPDVDSASDRSLLLAMLEAESLVDSRGWGGPPQLYALAGPAPDELELVERELGDGGLIEALGRVHWGPDVAGCVVVSELAALPAAIRDSVRIEASAADQWMSLQPDGRPARIAVAVGRGGDDERGLRVKGDEDLRVHADVAGDLVTALRATFSG